MANKRNLEQVSNLGEEEMGTILKKYLEGKARILELEVELRKERDKLARREEAIPELKHLGGLIRSLRKTKFTRETVDGRSILAPVRKKKKEAPTGGNETS